MTREDLLVLLREELSIDITMPPSSGFCSPNIQIELRLGEDVISEVQLSGDEIRDALGDY